MNRPWKMAHHRERQDGHLYVVAARERQIGDVVQVIEKVVLSTTSAYERPDYRLVEIRGGEARVLPGIEQTLKDARQRFEKTPA